MLIGETSLYESNHEQFLVFRRNLVARMSSMRAQHDQDERKLLENLREFDRLLQNNSASKNFILKKIDQRHEQIQLNELLAGERKTNRIHVRLSFDVNLRV